MNTQNDLTRTKMQLKKKKKVRYTHEILNDDRQKSLFNFFNKKI